MKFINLFKHVILLQTALLFSLCFVFSNNGVGIKTGFGISNEYTNMEEFKNKLGGDIILNYFNSTHNFLNFKFNLGYKNRGHNDYWNEFGVIQDYHLLILGPEMNYSLNKKRNNLYLLLGFDVGYLLNYNSSKSLIFDPFYDFGTVRKIQYAVNYGIGFNINSNFLIEININHCLLNKIKSGNNNPKPKAFDYYCGISLGYNFNQKNFSRRCPGVK